MVTAAGTPNSEVRHALVAVKVTSRWHPVVKASYKWLTVAPSSSGPAVMVVPSSKVQVNSVSGVTLVEPLTKLNVAGAQSPVGQPSGTTIAGLTNTLFSRVAVAEQDAVLNVKL